MVRVNFVYVIVKKAFDFLASLIVLGLFFPVLLLVGFLIKVSDGGPVFYKSKRVGYKGKTIVFYKFRTMIPNAEKLKHQLLKHNARPDGPLFKMKNDPRVTPLGKHLRKYSIDEIPQFINVIRGDMSLVGPRPHLPSEVAHYLPADHERLSVKPGVFGFPQIYGRNEIGFREWLDLDLEYVKKRSFITDAYIIARVLGVVFEPFVARFFNTGDKHSY